MTMIETAQRDFDQASDAVHYALASTSLAKRRELLDRLSVARERLYHWTTGRDHIESHYSDDDGPGAYG